MVVQLPASSNNDTMTCSSTTLSDFDMTLNACSGVRFATLLQEHLQSDDQAISSRAVRLSGRPTSSVGIIAANPAQSKYLETATMHIIATKNSDNGNNDSTAQATTTLSLDFCQLRSAEVYSDSSRIPTIQIGTALKDAQRRDFTVNALFYNVMEGQVEDWTGRGVADWCARRLVTPLDAFVTFKDDPLRVLRAVRFAIRYALTPRNDLVQAACDDTIHKALLRKVSRERVGKELEGMLVGPNTQPVPALKLIMEWHLAPVVLALPVSGVQCRSLTITNASSVSVSFSSHDKALAWDQAHRILPLIPTVWQGHSRHVNGAAVAAANHITIQSLAKEPLLILAALLLPLRHVVVTDLSNMNSSVTTFIVKESLKFKNADIADIAALTSLVDEAANLLRSVHASSPMDHNGKSGDNGTVSIRPSRLEVGLLLRQARELWVTLLLLATILLLHQHQQQQDEDDDSASTVDWIQVARAYIVTLGLDQCWQMRPLLDGQALMLTLSLPCGPTVGMYMEVQVGWMMSHHDGTLDDLRRGCNYPSPTVICWEPPLLVY
jgi:tRNA nucleotidyltransferase (CCA-adding enzyme)